jgi:N-methylhydantoinase A
VSCPLREGEIGRPRPNSSRPTGNGHRPVYFPQVGMVDAPVRYFDTLEAGERLIGPAIVESPVTTVVIDPGASVERTAVGSLLIAP